MRWWVYTMKPTQTRGVWGHAPPGKFLKNLNALRSILVHSERKHSNKTSYSKMTNNKGKVAIQQLDMQTFV